SCVVRAVVQVLDLNLELLARRCRDVGGTWLPQWHAADRGDFAGQSEYRKTVASVGRQFEIENVVAQIQILFERSSRAGGVIEFEQPLRLVGETKLFRRTKHAA